MNNAKNITWIKGEKYCRWKGMHHDEYTKLLGTDLDLSIDIPGVVIVGEIAYCDSADHFLKFLHTVAEPEDLHNLIHEVSHVRTFEQMRFDINIDLLREFESDLSAYYKELQKKCHETAIQ